MMKLLEIRNKLKAKKPTFTRHDAHKKKRVGLGWRKPKGRQNKMRLHRKGYARSRSTGFGSPKAVLGLSQEGLRQILVKNLADFQPLDANQDGIIIARAVGNRRRMQLVEFAQKHQFKILNLDAEKFKDSLSTSLKEKEVKKAELTKRQEQKAKARKQASAKASKKEASTSDKKEETSPEDKKLQEKKEHDKILTKGD